MQKSIFFFLLLTTTLFSKNFSYEVLEISKDIKKKMIKGNSWKEGCPVHTSNLRYLKLKYKNYENMDMIGELIVHRNIAKNTVNIFRELYNISYPISRMSLVNEFQGNDWKSIEANNTSVLNCRKVAGTNKWSNHAYGLAIDINPIENPYISRKGKISHKASLKYRKRRHLNRSLSSDKAVLLGNDKATLIFKKYGWKWGGDWKSIKDYQHFELKQR
jgi:hypothetical protein